MCNIVNARLDPTQTTTARRTIFKRLHARKREALKDIFDWLDTIPVSYREIKENHVINHRVYTYETTERDVYAFIRRIIVDWFQTNGDRPPPRWFFESEIDNVVRRATTIEAERINTLAESAGMMQPYQVQQIFFSQPYLDRIQGVYQRVFEEMKGFTGDTATDLARTLSNQIAMGKGIKSARKALAERFDIKMSRAETIARTELGKAHRDARRAQTKDARDRLGLDALSQWISALAPTSRPSHVERHLGIYTPEQDAEFYASPESQGGYINCLCVQQTVLRLKDGTLLGVRKK